MPLYSTPHVNKECGLLWPPRDDAPAPHVGTRQYIRGLPASFTNSCWASLGPRTMDTTTLSVLGVDDAELSRLLSDAGAPHDEVPRLLRRLRMYFLQGGSVDALLGDTSILEGWGVSRGAIALLRAVLSAAQQARQRHKRKRTDDRTFVDSVRASLEMLRVDLASTKVPAPPSDNYEDDAFESDDECDGGGLISRLSRRCLLIPDLLSWSYRRRCRRPPWPRRRS